MDLRDSWKSPVQQDREAEIEPLRDELKKLKAEFQIELESQKKINAELEKEIKEKTKVRSHYSFIYETLGSDSFIQYVHWIFLFGVDPPKDQYKKSEGFSRFIRGTAGLSKDLLTKYIDFQASMIENGIQSGKIFTYQERLKETESNNAELRKKLRHFSKGDSLSKSPLVKLEQKATNNA